MNRWLELYPVPACVAERRRPPASRGAGWRFAYATGASLPSARPELADLAAVPFPCEAGGRLAPRSTAATAITAGPHTPTRSG